MDIHRFIPKTRRQWFITGGITLGIIILAVGGALIVHANNVAQIQDAVPIATNSTPTPGQLASPTTAATPTPVPQVENKLTGELVASDAAYLTPLAVMIENHQDARPQSGLNSANLVYEAIAEGGITRFMAVFADPRQSVRVGPIRSARTYYVDFATELNAFYAHVGGNADALDQLAATKVYNLDEFSVGEPTFKRDFSRNVALEHTMYSTTSQLWDYAVNSRKYPTTATYAAWNFTDSPATSTLPASQTVTINFSGPDFKVDWHYDPTTNSYTRYMAGKPHVNAGDNAPITAKNIIIQTVQNTPVVTRINEHGWRYTLTGSGKATIVKNGTSIEATWKKEGTGRTRYYDASGNEISLTKGKIWVEIVHPDISFSVSK